MASICSSLLFRGLFHASSLPGIGRTILVFPMPRAGIAHGRIRCAASESGEGGQKVSARLSMMQQVLQEAEERARYAGSEPTPKEKNRINKDGDLVISSTKTRSQKGNIEDALSKLQEIVDAASYVPPPPSEEQKKRIQKLAAIGEQKRMQSKRALSQKKSIRRTRDSWD